MGTHIECFFPHAVERTSKSILAIINATFGQLGNDLETIREKGRFSSHGGSCWWCVENDNGALTGEGPFGFSIDVCPAVVVFTSIERFSAVQSPEQGIQAALARVFESMAVAFGSNRQFAVASGGFGDTDGACALAYDGAQFAEICKCLEETIGPPARTWQALQADLGNWYLSDSVAFPRPV